MKTRYLTLGLTLCLAANAVVGGSAGTVVAAFRSGTQGYKTWVRHEGTYFAVEHEVLAHFDSLGNKLDDFTPVIRAVPDEVFFSPDGGLFVGFGDLKPFALYKLRSDGSLDPDFTQFRSSLGGDELFGTVVAIGADGEGGCYVSGRFDRLWNERSDITAHWMAHADRWGNLRPVVSDPAYLPLVQGGDKCLVQDGADLIYVHQYGMVRISPDGTVRPFGEASGVVWDRDGIMGACYDRRFGLAVIGCGRRQEERRSSSFCAVYSLDGTLVPYFQQHVRFGHSASGVNAIVWDHAGRLIIGWLWDGWLEENGRDLGELNPVRRINWPPPFPPTEWYPFDGFPWGDNGLVKRLLPDGHLDPAWSRALWFNSSTTRVSVLPNNDVLVNGAFTNVCGFRTGSRVTGSLVRLTGEPATASNPQQSVRGRIEPGDLPLIMGLILDGDTARDVLIRAVGPSLAQFGVPDPAPKTKLTLYRGSERIVSTLPGTNTEPVKWATQRTGAFPLSFHEGQALLQLPPGVYTVHIELPEDATAGGTVLGEIYFL